jgi:predicted  nucleic acid-binding Zn-ribbon protein
MQKLKRFAGPFTILLVLVAGWLILQNRWAIYDYFRLRNYDPPARIVQLADATTMDDETRRLFYVHYPSIEPKDQFRQHCTNAEVTIVLGCYVPLQGIYLADIQDKRLDGIVEVTAAHEVLHVAWDRLSSDERERLASLLNKVYSKLGNERIKKTIAEYKANGADIDNELHSIIGTEVRDLPAELEEYYAQYFDDRLKIVEFSEKYETTFNKLKAQADNIAAELKALAAEIDSGNRALSDKAVQISAERQRLEELLRQNRTDEYNAAVPGFNAMVDAYNADVARTENLIDRHNSLIQEIKQIVLIQSELYDAIDSRPEQISK